MPALYNFDFAQNAQVLNLSYHAVIGGSVKGYSTPEIVEACHKEFRACDGELFPCLQQLFWKLENKCTRTKEYKDYAKYAKAQNYFTVDLDAFKVSLKATISQLNEACGGHWLGVQ